MGVWHWDLAQDRRYFDDQACYLLGIEPAAFTGTGDEFFRVVHPDDREMLRAALAGTIEQDLSYEPQYRAVWPDGSVHHIAARGKLVRNEASDRPERINGIIWDVTERVNAEQALRQSEERFATVFRSSPIGISLARLSDGQYLDVNDAFLRFFGYEREEVIGRDPFSLGIWVHVEDRTGMVDILREQGRVPGFETVFRMKTGEIRNALVVTELVDVAQERYLLGLTLDITERKQAEEALIQSEKKYRSIFDNAIEGIFQTTPDGRYLTVNPALARMYGYTSPEEMMGAVTDLQEQQYVIPEDRVRLKALYEQQGFVKRFEAQVYTKSGDKVWISMNAYAVADRAGNTLYYEGTAENITERKRLEDQLRQAQKMEAIGTLAGGVAHDFNNILTVIMGLGNLIQMSIDKGDTLRPYIDQIVASSERAADLTQSLLAFSRRQRITPEAHTVNGVVTSTAKLLKRLLPEDIELKCDLTDKKTLTMLDLTQIGQVIMNLAINARDAMPHGGSLIIRTERSKLDENFKKIHGFGRPGNYVKLSVSDTGIGMDESTMKRIFEPFFTTKEVGKGTGLGLASAYGIVKQHDGYITVSSALSMGTTFDIYLPLIDTPHPRRVSAVPETKGGAETILIVEDDRDVRSTLTRILEKQGYITIEAMDGDDALRLYEEHRTEVDLIILDVVMPGRNGKEVLDEITRINPSVKAVFVSGYTGDIVIDKGVENDSVDFLQKPLSVPKLLSKVREVLDR